MKKDIAEKLSKFSVPLGLVDYINPIFYGITTFTIIKNMNNTMNVPNYIIFIIGAVLSLIFGLAIPTLKVLVGTGKVKFKMPVNFVFFVNSGILISGLSLFQNVMKVKYYIILAILIVIFLVLYLLYNKTKKFNTIAVLTGVIGYLFIYVSLITLALQNDIIISAILYGISICFSLALCMVGIKANLKDARVHWILEISNIICQCSVAIGTIILFI